MRGFLKEFKSELNWEKAEEIFLNALTFGDKPPGKRKMIIEVIE